MKNTKYPTHHMDAHPAPPHLVGSGQKQDGKYGNISEHHRKLPGRGKEACLISDGSRVHALINHHPEKHYTTPGHTEMKPFRHEHDGMNHHVPHAFRAHHQPEGGVPKHTKLAHGPMGKHEHSPKGAVTQGYSPLRFSGSPHAHQVGKNRARFKHVDYHETGKSSRTPHKKGIAK